MWDSVLSALRSPDNRYYITSPNCTFVPEPLVGGVIVALRADYRYGSPDPIQWPQIVAQPPFEYLCTIRRRVHSPDPQAVMCADPPDKEFEVISGCELTSLGLFRNSSLVTLLAQARDLDHTIERRDGTTPDHLQWLASAVRQGSIGSVASPPHFVTPAYDIATSSVTG